MAGVINRIEPTDWKVSPMAGVINRIEPTDWKVSTGPAGL
jgi:hypothetical protein